MLTTGTADGPLLFFDIYDGQDLTRDDVNIECRGPEDIRCEAMAALPAIARDTIPKNGDRQALTVLVRNSGHLTVYSATITVAGTRLGEDMPVPADAAQPASLASARDPPQRPGRTGISFVE